ncbi:hypothetical protein [Candidatus Solirubrobacter pratensis]|uniref:hypothetical protein n=1 Tax=Candidatus Solirubrobacter pratensis TaxID=1298857 RepID=UPI00041A4106|nr:hypothetical protein [Candidatus Solirubrobacter pratensis]
MWRWALVLLVSLAVPAAADAAAPVKVGDGPLLGLAARGGAAFVVFERDSASTPLALVRSSGSSAGRPAAFGGPGAENVDMAAGAEGVRIAWSRTISSAFEYFVAPAQRLADPESAGFGTGPPQLDAAGELAYPDRVGNATLAGRPLTDDAPEHRHLPLDAAGGLVLDLDQQRTHTELRLLGGPSRPILSVSRLADVEASLAISGHTAYVAYAIGGSTLLATQRGDGWTTRRIASGTSGRPAVARAGSTTYVAYARNGAVRLGGARIAAGGGPLLATDGTRVFAGYTHAGRAYLFRAR